MNGERGVDALRLQAKAQIERKQWAAAAETLQQILAIFPGNAEVLLQLSYMHSLDGHYRLARECALQASEGALADEAVVTDLLARLRTFNEAGALQRVLHRLGPPQRMSIPVLLAAGVQTSYLNLQVDALRYFDEAKRADPLFPPTLISRAQVLTYLARFDQAKTDIETVIGRAPQIANAYLVQAQLRRQTPEDNHVDAIRRELSKPGRLAMDMAHLGFALHKELDDLADVDGAWRALELACRAKRSTLAYDKQDGRDLVDDLIALPIRAESERDSPDLRSRPVFIVGMHRSGTTLLEQLLDGHEHVKGVGELYDFTSSMRWATDHHCPQVIDREIVRRAPGADLSQAGRRYLEGLAWRLGDEVLFTDKLPSNFLNIGFICQALPQAKILHMVRDPVETCFSNLRELFSSANPYSYDQRELADFYLQYRRLMAHWHVAYPGRILDVDYAELTRNPDAVMRKVAAFCGIEYTDAMSDPRSSTRAVATASAVQVRDKVIRRQVPKWVPYAKYLQPLIEALRQGGIEVPELPA